MKNIWRGLCLAVFITGVISFARTQTRDKVESSDVEPAASYVLITTHYEMSSDGAKRNVSERIRYVKANGEWRQMRHDPSDTAMDIRKGGPVFASTEKGVIHTAPSVEPKFVSEAADQQIRDCFSSPRCLRVQPGFVRMDEVAGLKVYVFKIESPDPASPVDWVEQSYSPKTGYMMLRVVDHFRDGSQLVMEATKVEFRDVPENLNDDIKAIQTNKQQ